jgi:cytochrome c biogenesis factor
MNIKESIGKIKELLILVLLLFLAQVSVSVVSSLIYYVLYKEFSSKQIICVNLTFLVIIFLPMFIIYANSWLKDYRERN